MNALPVTTEAFRIAEEWELIDKAEERMFSAVGGVLVHCPIRHHFTPGLYIREMHVPAGTVITSKVHRTEHPYVVSQGRLEVFVPGEGIVMVSAPHFGITTIGTRRLAIVHEDLIWTTFHRTDAKTLEEIEDEIWDRTYRNPLLTDEQIAQMEEAQKPKEIA